MTIRCELREPILQHEMRRARSVRQWFLRLSTRLERKVRIMIMITMMMIMLVIMALMFMTMMMIETMMMTGRDRMVGFKVGVI